MKKIVTFCAVLTLALAMSIMFVSCGGDKSGNSGNPDNPNNPDNPGGGIVPVPPISVSNELEWIATTAIIKASGNNKSYTINVTDDLSLPGDDSTAVYNFGSTENITVTIDGSGKSITRTSAGFLFNINSKQTFIIKDISLDGNGIDIDKPLVCVSYSSTAFIMQGAASVTGANSYGNSAIEVTNGTFTMEDSSTVQGNINRGLYGGGVKMNGGTFTMKDNSRLYNNKADGGGGIRIAGGAKVIMENNAEISGNQATASSLGRGGGVQLLDGTFTMKDSAKVSGNTASLGGGVLIDGGTFNMYDESVVSGNTATGTLDYLGGGGGVYVQTGAFRFISGTVYGNNASTELKNTVTGSGATGAALYIKAGSTAERGTYNGNTWTSSGTLTTTDSTIN